MDCTDGSIDGSVFGKPMPAIGAYAAAGTLVCAIAMVVDAAKGFRSKQYWIPNNYFTMNAASLAVFGVAIKVLVDINSPMPSRIDQLGKFSSSAFICIMLVNIQPSLGKLEKGELLMNTIALSIFVINSIVNICIEIHTGVIYTFIAAHIVMMVTMSLILYDSIVIAAYLPVLKNYLDHKFEGKYRCEIVGIHNDKTPKKLREYLMKVSMMAQSSCPHFVMARSSRCFSLVVLGLVSALTLFFIMFATITHQDGFINSKTCFGESDYGWSTFGILITQVIAVAAGLVAPISRYIYLMRAMEGGELHNPPAEKEEEEEFWMHHLEVSKEKPIFPYIEDRQRQPAVYEIKYLLHHIVSIHPLRFLYQFMNGAFMYIVSGKSGLEKNFTPSPMPEDFSPEPENLAAYFLHMKGEERSIKLMEKPCSFVTQRCIDAGMRANPHNLVEFLKGHLSHDFGGVASFDDEEIPPLAGSGSSSESPPNCWSLVVLTLTSVATALPIIDRASKERLMRSVNESLIYVKLVEDHMNSQHKFINIRATANIVWLGLDRRCHWLDINLQELALKAANSKEVLFRLANSSREYFSNYTTSHHRHDQKKKQKKRDVDMVRGSLMGMVSKARSESEMIRTCKAVAAHSMYRTCQTMLQQQQDCQNESNNVVFKKLSVTIADILGACFVNLRPCIVSICERCSIEKRRETVLEMLKVFGEVEEIMEILAQEGRNIPDVPDDERGFIDKWRSYLKHQKDLNSGHLNIV